jgi:hypothetical protein
LSGFPGPGEKTLHTHSGGVLHHNDCTYCQHRKALKGPQKGRRKPREVEFCGLTDTQIPAPNDVKLRWCNAYQQRGCTCPACMNGKYKNQTVITIDK